MSVRASNYRHVYATQPKPENVYGNLKPSGTAWDSNIADVNGKYLAVNYQVSGGGAFLVTLLSRAGKLPDIFPLCRAHSAPVLDVAWSPFDEDLIASASEDCKVQLTRIDEAALERVFTDDSYSLQDFTPLATTMSHGRKVGNLLWHPTAKNVLASASYEVKLWDVESSSAQIELQAHPDMVQAMSFNSNGTLLATTCKDKKLRLFDVRSGPAPIRVVDSHTGVKASRVCWMGDSDLICTTGFSKMSDRQVFVWNAGALDKPVKSLNIDQSPGSLMPFWSPNQVLFLAGKGDGNIRYYEWENDDLHFLTEYKSLTPQRGMAFLPRRHLNVHEHEIMRGYKVTNNTVEPLSFVVPRKSDAFQSDIHPPALAGEPALSASEFFGGKTSEPRYVSLESQQSVSAPPKSAPTTVSTPASTPARQASVPTPATSAPTPTRHETAPAKSASTNSTSAPTAAAASGARANASDDESTFPVPKPTPAAAASAVPSSSPAPVAASSPAVNGDSSADLSSLRREIDDLKNELSERDSLIRSLELQVEKLSSWKKAVVESVGR